MGTFHYPNGKKVTSIVKKQSSSSIKKQISYSNRGMSLEDDINQSNEYYLLTNQAIIHKKPTPVQIVNVEYPKRSAAVIREAYFKLASTTDYNGVYKGRYIDFEAKETKNKTSFPLKNFHEHQLIHMQHILDHGGISFVILRFSSTDESFLFDSSHLISFWKEQSLGRKSIPKGEIEEKGHSITIGYQPRLNYLHVVDSVYF
ncbi:Holliday junction resolvase RecU [Fictibacillus phosphorivorans]|uniref:Holliday junction resolvase RecU n=1 Tax=Fictibacillus phosphorivorans TaxID=1221500 RepID=A0A163R544_9BACL|nr:Holliday junction resolvase RecU [Fictibacillus phosphorivorans]KZE66204.1 Holliday junction resolvase RecU [Fictibacillus phosphorivorans]